MVVYGDNKFDDKYDDWQSNSHIMLVNTNDKGEAKCRIFA